MDESYDSEDKVRVNSDLDDSSRDYAAVLTSN
jgi:hypothetical protein